MKKLILITLSFVANATFSQANGDDFRKKGDLMNAINAYKVVFNKGKLNPKNTYNLACAYALTYQKDSAFYYLNIALKNDSRLWVLADNDFYPLVDDKRWAAIQNQQFKKFQIKNGKIKNLEYAKQLIHLIIKDQALDYQQNMARQYYMKNGHIPHWFYPIMEMKKEINYQNFSTMEKLIKQYGWPTYSIVGKLAADAPLLVINHLEGEEIRIKYLPKIKDACLQKEGSCMEYAKIQDRILVNTNQKQIYGMQFRYDKNRNLEPFPIKNPEYVDQKRKAIGLEPIKQYLKRKINYNWTIKQKIKS